LAAPGDDVVAVLDALLVAAALADAALAAELLLDDDDPPHPPRPQPTATASAARAILPRRRGVSVARCGEEITGPVLRDVSGVA